VGEKIIIISIVTKNRLASSSHVHQNKLWQPHTNIAALTERNLGPIPRTASHRNLLHPRLRIPTLHLRKPLHRPNRKIISLRQRILLPQANPRPAAKGQVIPAWSQRRIRPALGAEDSGVRAESRRLAHHGVGVVHDAVAFGDEKGLEAICAAAVGEDGVFEGEFAEDGDGGEEAEG